MTCRKRKSEFQVQSYKYATAHDPETHSSHFGELPEIRYEEDALQVRTYAWWLLMSANLVVSYAGIRNLQNSCPRCAASLSGKLIISFEKSKGKGWPGFGRIRESDSFSGYLECRVLRTQRSRP